MKKILPLAVLVCALPMGACSLFGQKTAPAQSAAQAIPWFAVPIIEAGWTYVDFGSNGGVELAHDVITLHQGERLEGLKYAGNAAELLGEKLDCYEIKLEARRTGGRDIFLGLTFPVGTKESASLILGGWGGSVCGISSVDGGDASGNPYKSIVNFEDNQWYAVTVHVDAKEVSATLDGKPLFSVPRAGRHFDLRAEVEPTAPLGLFTFGTSAQVRGLSVRQLK